MPCQNDKGPSKRYNNIFSFSENAGRKKQEEGDAPINHTMQTTYQNWSLLYIKNGSTTNGSTSVLKRKKYSSPLANSLLPPQHHRCRHRHLVEALLSRPPPGDLSSPKEVDESRSPKKRLGRPISGRS